jgi:hypothetical protein
MACVELRERPFTDSDHDRLALHLDENVAEVSSATPIRELSSRGYGPYFSVDIHFEPHESIDGIESYHRLTCQYIPDIGFDLLRIESVDNGLYKVYADSDASCAYHIIEVREVECGLESCSFEILKNEVVHFL